MRIKTLAITAIALFGLAVPASAGAQTLIGSGSVAAQPVLEALFKTYTKTVNHKIHFSYTPDGGNTGIKDIQSGKSQFAGQSRAPLPSDTGTTYYELYLDGLCLDVNPANKLSNITIEQLRAIYLGQLTNWGALGARASAQRSTRSVATPTEAPTPSSCRRFSMNMPPPRSSTP